MTIFTHLLYGPGEEPRGLPDLDPASVKAIVPHHTASSETKTPQTLDREHRDLGWGAIGYHALVYQNGTVWAARPLTFKGAHAYDSETRKGWNSTSWGVAFVGDATRKPPGFAARKALVSVCWELREMALKYGARDLQILGHREAMARKGLTGYTDCPGGDWVTEVRDRCPLPGSRGIRQLLI